MKFGQVEDPSLIDFTIPQDHINTSLVLKKGKEGLKDVFVGCAKWNKTDLKGFYPKGTKDELSYYSTQFNSIEMNATFYGMPTPDQVFVWKNKTPDSFKFFPKITNTVSHFRRLKDVTEPVTQFASAIMNFGEKLGMVFLQLHDNFKPKDFDRLKKFIKDWPVEVPLAIELRNTEWFIDENVFNETCELFEQHNITNIIVDTAGRRDMMHMRLTTPTAFVRYVGANAESDYTRLDEWVQKIVKWKEEGLQNVYFFIHQNIEKASPLLSAHFIDNLNKAIGSELLIPKMADSQPTLF
ncbi:hypothetical protein BAZ12_19985 [Elizabethkingia miricola]|uniref:DUF72 domain-containing protein n=1 Tax=Elizabethkingia miricola TaxID=172045 RepID=A0AAQ1PJF1_ELIMR|nr:MULTISPECIES: DUF72 domain-containing protein [Elizabethkingia]KUY16980.1 hypothetical protein ATB95_11375 [Elizabethkingia miricola]MCL1654736.1 DUF72 domain-containing protein [Elizabethkingia miricola]OPC34834.1 hypothetical protein BAX99_08235 [Elizabethkingia miricola]OPC72470.1 hypothetical protein BAZ13_07165 [Elizabethkingia miricola]OPC76288.1 hypothetical protein BAZ12_19985 [Elizabethkingia miricola]